MDGALHGARFLCSMRKRYAAMRGLGVLRGEVEKETGAQCRSGDMSGAEHPRPSRVRVALSDSSDSVRRTLDHGGTVSLLSPAPRCARGSSFTSLNRTPVTQGDCSFLVALQEVPGLRSHASSHSGFLPLF